MDSSNDLTITPTSGVGLTKPVVDPENNIDHFFLNISIKDEPLDIMECESETLLNEYDVKKELHTKIKEEIDDTEITSHIDSGNPKGSSDDLENTIEISNNSSLEIGTESVIEQNEITRDKDFDSKITSEIPKDDDKVRNEQNLKDNSSPKIIKTIKINGQTKTCILVNDPGLKQSIFENVEKARKSPTKMPISKTSAENHTVKRQILQSDISTLKTGPSVNAIPEKEEVSSKLIEQKSTYPIVQCSRCLSKVRLDNFRQHIDSCPPRKCGTKKKSDTISIARKQNGRDNPKPISCESVHADQKKPESNNNLNTTNEKNRSLLIDEHKSADDFDQHVRINKTLQNNQTDNQSTVQKKIHIISDCHVKQSSENEKPLQNVSTIVCNKCRFESRSIIIMEIHKQKHSSDTLETSKTINQSANKNNLTAGSMMVQQISARFKNICAPNNLDNSLSRRRSKSMSSFKMLKAANGPLPQSKNDDDLEFMGFHKSVVEKATKTSSEAQQIIKGCEKPQTNQTSMDRNNGAEPNSNNQDNVITNQIAVTNNETEKSIIEICEDIKVEEGVLEEKNESGDTEQPTVEIDETSVRTRSKSVSKPLPAENWQDAPRRSLRIRSKSFSANKFDRDDSPERSRARTRSRSVVRDKIKSNDRDLKRSKSVPRSRLNTNKDRDEDKSFQEDSRNVKSKSSWSRSRSKSVVESSGIHPLTYYQNFLKSRSKSVERSRLVPSNENNNSSDKCTEKSSERDRNSISDSDINNFYDIKISQVEESSDKYSDNCLLLADNTFSCKICSFTTDKSRVLTDHQRNHRRSNNPIYQCVYCNQRYTRYMLYLHVQAVHPGQKFQIYDDQLNKSQISSTPRVSSDVRKLSNSAGETLNKEAASSTNIFPNDMQNQLSPFFVLSKGKTGRSIYDCKLCSFKSSYLSKIRAHIDGHMISKDTLKCYKCNYQSTISFMKNHVKNCCGSETNDLFEKYFDYTKSEQKGETVFKCRLCSYVCYRLTGINVHVRTHKSNLPMEKCPKCDFISTACATKMHKMKCVGTPAQKSQTNLDDASKIMFRCSSCTFSTSLRIKLKLHMRKCHAKLKSIDNKLLKCKLCSFVTIRKINLVQHQQSHDRNSPIKKCPHCNFRSSANVLYKHTLKCTKEAEKKKVTSKKWYCCKFCDFKSLRCQLYSAHMKKHKKNKGIKCNLCSVVCSDQNYMKMHLKSHENNAMKECIHCDFRSTPAQLRRHICSSKLSPKIPENVASPTKDTRLMFKCSECSFSTYLRIKLNFHMKKYHQKHSSLKEHYFKSETLFQCKYCSYRNSRALLIRSHVRTHVVFNMPVKSCDFCDYKSTAPSLKKHIQRCKVQKLPLPCGNNEAGSSIPENVPAKETPNDPSSKVRRCRTPMKLSREIVLDANETENIDKYNGTDKAKKGITSHPSQEKNPEKRKKLNKLSLEKNFRCSLCDWSGAYKKSLKGHLEGIHVKELISQTNFHLVFKCEMCTFITLFIRKILNHAHITGHTYETIDKDKMLPPPLNKQCPYCNFEGTAKDLNGHTCPSHTIISTPKPNNTVVEIFKCDLCYYSTNSELNLKIHESECNARNFRTDSVSPTKIIGGQSSTNLECSYCSFTSKYPHSVRRHMELHLRSLKRKRSNSETNDANTIISEMPPSERPRRSKSQSRWVSTDNSKSVVKGHATEHLDVTPRLSNGTRNDISQKKALESEQSVNSNISTNPKWMFNCTKCPYTTNLRIKLKFHLEKSHSVLQRQCEYCSFVTTAAHSLTQHITTHTVRKMPIMECKSCDFKSTARALKNHILKCHHKKMDK